MLVRITIALVLLVIDLLWFFSRYPNLRERYAGHINWAAGNLDLITKEIFDFRVLFFVFLIFIPAVLVSWILAEVDSWISERKMEEER